MKQWLKVFGITIGVMILAVLPGVIGMAVLSFLAMKDDAELQ